LKRRLKEKARALPVAGALDIANTQLPGIVPGEQLATKCPAFPASAESAGGRRGQLERDTELFLRMLFSALVDADFLDTEADFDSRRLGLRGGTPSLPELWARFEANQAGVTGRQDDALNLIRHEIYQACVVAGDGRSGIFSLTVPTGGGKTRSGTGPEAQWWRRRARARGRALCYNPSAEGEKDMAILKVARLGHPVLRKVAAPVPAKEIGSPEIQRLIDDMVETMREYNGAGLAANQVHVPKQICVIEVAGNPRYPDAPSIPLTVLVNPVVTPLTVEMEDGWEGCLSIPDMRGMVPRYTTVRLEAFDRAGEKLSVVAKEFFARVVQHETDHLNGLVYVDRMKDLSTLTHLAEWSRYWLGNAEQDD